ncbi:TraB/GumN family protein [Sphingobacteriales bacterium UPWRP_1]|nr:hypothetical protein BVG80_15895 [Sphingobacteriales bacterium TSM_CSM]PSJ73162.1 TraB/GumN family protein [Sphingobacteriales bacterium UPWRP_1]
MNTAAYKLRAFFIPAFLFILLQCPSLLAQPFNSLLWRIEGNSLQQPSYLYGTMHSRDEQVHNLGDSVLLKLNACDAVALEIVTDQMGLKDMLQAMSQMYMKDTTLQDLYTKTEDYRKVKSYVSRKMGVMGFLYNPEKIKPMFLASMLDEMEQEEEQSKNKNLLLDMYFQQVGKDTGKRLISIETIDEQMAAIDQMPLKMQAEMLLDQVNNAGKYDTMGHVMLQYYAEENLDALLQLYEGEKETMTESFDQAIVVLRNRNMATRMDSFMRLQPTFTAVGALHLPGKDGVINLLRQKGYSVQPVYSPNKMPKNTANFNTPATGGGNAQPMPKPPVLLDADEAGFQVLLPDSAKTEWLEDDIILYTCSDAQSGLFYNIAYTALPDSASAQNNEAFYNQVAERLAKTKGAKLLYQKTVNVLEALAQEGEMDMGELLPGIHLRYVMLRTGTDFYLLSVTGLPEKLKNERVNTFFDSFMVAP